MPDCLAENYLPAGYKPQHLERSSRDDVRTRTLLQDRRVLGSVRELYADDFPATSNHSPLRFGRCPVRSPWGESGAPFREALASFGGLLCGVADRLIVGG